MSALVRSRLSQVVGTRGAAMKVEMQVVKKEINERLIDTSESTFNIGLADGILVIIGETREFSRSCQ
nr:hypothetical protein [Tanacetum cinerariifolium]